ncbi:carbohydrate ABC transporter substrate-binding protein (CUT1 family) [Saccharopolyspora erythraea NRRL 2338]|uniref:ABC sugar transporter, substrate-binding component n=2 Tax=Saccharopolyspora erythraea TaxID=1836 RepID=A4FHA6_SACEN|nr:sugar ABC transporter substrate-binding protein [Saccharopolyspora erythraea]EQD86839.1 sugar ABC transporter substrate-binding protein [Saccharopolyspora erythraea D]PFG97131.1 carbohydrate ABC transporter substrate-binding protein (CUT1 family) [Saccharopolyspora erythraea NRRL 2338]QRK87334.1 sugar ABC transporter substrate-binding protein [Saccharopolyspora erythraea]CAM03431.1 ABC sugar transporter, substrate-binding component [Saccharopolyspora erythraea NRRL 2338]
MPMRSRRRTPALALLAVAALLLLTGCAGAGAIGAGGRTLVVAIVSNPQMEDAIALSDRFERENPGIHLKFVQLPENQARAKITSSTATGGGEFDVVMISNYETPQWAANGWLENLQPYIDASPGYDPGDFIPSIRDSLSYQGAMHAVPFYGESSFLAYRKDLFDRAGLRMPERPTWQQIAELAAKLDDDKAGMAGICLRGKPGWGESLAPFTTVANTFGARYFDENWNAQLTSPEFRAAAEFYVKLVREHGEVGASSAGFSECGTRYAQGQAAMWYDATVMAGTNEDPASSKIVGKSGYVAAPVERTPDSGWLYTWSLAMPKVAEDKDAAWRFMRWMTDKRFVREVGTTFGWNRVPPGCRLSTYQIPEYQQAAQAYAQPTLDGINRATQANTMTRPVPYPGIQFAGIPEFQDLGTRVSQQLSAAVAGQISVDEALRQSQEYAETVGESYRETR